MPPDAVARVYSFNCLMPKFRAVSSLLLRVHFSTAYAQVIQHRSVPLQGVTPPGRTRTDNCAGEPLVETILRVHCLIAWPDDTHLPIASAFGFSLHLELPRRSVSER